MPTTINLNNPQAPSSLNQAAIEALIVAELAKYSNESITAIFNGDGTTDNATAFTTQLATATTAGKALYVPKGNYRIGGVVPLLSNSTVINHPETVYLVDNDFVGTGDLASYCTPFSANGTYGTEILLTTDSLEYDKTLTVGSVSGFAEGDLVMVGSDIQYRDNVCRAGEYQYIADITGTTITLRGGLRDDYTVADGAFVQKITPVENIKFIGGTIQSTVDGHTGSSHVALRAERAVNVLFKDVTVKSFANIGIELCAVLDGLVTGCRGYDIGWSESNETVNGTGYFTLGSQGSEGCVFENLYSERCGKGFDVSGRSSQHGVCRNIKVVDSHFKNCTRQVVGLHANSHLITFDNVSGNCVEGLNIRTWDVTFNNCDFVIEGAGAGMSFSTDARAGYFHMRGTKIHNTGSEAISIRGSTSDGGTQDYLDIEISDSVLTCADGVALEIGARADSDVLGLHLNNNRVRTEGAFPALRLEGDNSESIRDAKVIGGVYEAPNSPTGAIDVVADSGSTVEVDLIGVTAKGGVYGLHSSGLGTRDIQSTIPRYSGSSAATLGV